MKSLLRSYLINLTSIYLALSFVKGFSYDHKIQTLLLGGACFTLINWFIKPLVKLLTLPLNFLTLGTFGWLVNILMVFLLLRVFPQFTISSFFFNGFSSEFFILPAFNFNVFLTYLAVSFIIALTGSFLFWLVK